MSSIPPESDDSNLPTKATIRDYALRLTHSRTGLKLTPMQRLVVIALADKYNQTKGYAWPSHRWLCEVVGCDDRYLRRLIQGLQQCGVLHVAARRYQGRSTSNVYLFSELLTWDDDQNVAGKNLPAIEGNIYPVQEGRNYPGQEGNSYPPLEPLLEPVSGTSHASRRAHPSDDDAPLLLFANSQKPTLTGKPLETALYRELFHLAERRLRSHLNTSEVAALRGAISAVLREHPSGMIESEIPDIARWLHENDPRMRIAS